MKNIGVIFVIVFSLLMFLTFLADNINTPAHFIAILGFLAGSIFGILAEKGD